MGDSVGAAVGSFVGYAVGEPVGTDVGYLVGKAVGTDVGYAVGAGVFAHACFRSESWLTCCCSVANPVGHSHS